MLIWVKALQSKNRKEMNVPWDDRKIVALYLRRDETAIRRLPRNTGARLRALPGMDRHNDLVTAEECESDIGVWRRHTIPPP